jgi:hypothetical protein
MKERPPDEESHLRHGPLAPLLIGWKEWAALPDWGVRRMKVKIDTGARTSALDVSSYELLEVPGVGLVARLWLELDRKRPGTKKIVHTPVLRLVSVRNTSGHSEQRPLVETRVRIGSKEKRIRLTVANRAGMLHRMILGREALAGDFVVDVSRKFMLK